MARKPSRVRRELRAQAELFNSVRSSVLSEALSKSDPFLPASSKGYRLTHLTINKSLGYTKAPSANLEHTIRARQGLAPVLTIHGTGRVEPATVNGVKIVMHNRRKPVVVDLGHVGNKPRINWTAPKLQRFSEPAQRPVTDFEATTLEHKSLANQQLDYQFSLAAKETKD